MKITLRKLHMDILTILYPWTKAIHVIAMVAWMAGLFYLPRLFVHHAERGSDIGEPTETFILMEEKLLKLIMNPAMIATWFFGLALVATPGVVSWINDAWIYPKISAVLALTWFHHWLSMRRRDFEGRRNSITGRQYRLMNELPTVALVLIIIMVIVRPF